jgi:subtilisin family serine protease
MIPVSRIYAVVDSGDDKLFKDYQSRDFESLKRFLKSRLRCDADFDLELRSSNWPRQVNVGDDPRTQVPKLIFSIKFSNADVRSGALERAALRTDNDAFANAPITVADHWCPIGPDQLLFGTRGDARKLIGADELKTSGLSGKGVNVVIIDQGLNKEWIDKNFGAGRYKCGWSFTPLGNDRRPEQRPGETSVEDAGHGLMIARNVLDIAPEASLYDLPLVPPRIHNIQTYLCEAHAAYVSMLADIRRWGGNWVLVNAWAVFDRGDESPLGGYTENLCDGPFKLHEFTQDVAGAIDSNIDVLFCAGNCGQFCPDGRCGPNDNGPGRSIWGANSFHRVLTVGAVRTDGTWIGYSSQGPGQPKLGPPGSQEINQKPDFSVPSGFVEDHDAHVVNRGTSAATGIAAGVVAALRSKWDAATLKPEQLKSVLNSTARQPSSTSWDPRLGNGIIDIPAVLKKLEAR